MRIALLIFTGSIAALAVLTAPALARNSNTQKIDDPPASTASASPNSSQACHAYQQAPDGSWIPLPCQEPGATSQAQTQHKSANRHADEDTR
jgi:hypothetical protein